MTEKNNNSKKGCLMALRPRLLGRRAQSTVEFVALLLFILGVFLVFQKYIGRGLAGRWKSVGDSLGHGKIYDPDSGITTECEYHPSLTAWFDRMCYESTCRAICGNLPSSPACTTCIFNSCMNPDCV